jgi:hypothetical protein
MKAISRRVNDRPDSIRKHVYIVSLQRDEDPDREGIQKSVR